MPSKPARIGWRWSGQDSSYPFGECPVSGVHGSAFQYALRKNRKAMKKYRKDTGTKSALPSGRPTDFGKAGVREMNRL
jgi:hypothetical protein